MSTTPRTPVLRRRPSDRLLGGVCGGIADHTGIDVNVLRVLVVLLTVVTWVGLPAYLAAWLLIPQEGQERSGAERLLAR